MTRYISGLVSPLTRFKPLPFLILEELPEPIYTTTYGAFSFTGVKIEKCADISPHFPVFEKHIGP